MDNLNQKSLKSKVKSKFKKGLTLIEAAMVLAISTLVVAGVMVFFQSASMNSKTNEAVAQLGEMQSIIRSIYANSPNYNGVSSAALISANALPNKMISGATVVHAFNSTVIVAAADSGCSGCRNSFYITLNNIPAEACSKLGTMDLGRGFVSLRINTTDIGLPTNVTTVGAACGGSGNTSMRWQFL